MAFCHSTLKRENGTFRKGELSLKKRSIIAAAMIITLALLLSGCNDPKEEILSGEYERKEIKAQIIKFDDQPNVRSEPCVSSDPEATNSFGSLDAAGFCIEVSKMYATDRELDGNGSFYGLLVTDILATPEGNTWFPKTIGEDKDGIVWINAKSVEILF